MIGAKIELAHPVREGSPDWRDESGQSLHEALLELATPERWPAETERGALSRQALAGRYQGMRLLGAQRGWVAVWHPALVAYLVGLGLSAGCVRDLHHLLHGLVVAGLLQPRAEARSVPSMGTVWHYILKAEA